MASKSEIEEFKKKAKLNSLERSASDIITKVKDRAKIDVIYNVEEFLEINTIWGNKLMVKLSDGHDTYKFWSFPRLTKLFYHTDEHGKPKKLKDPSEDVPKQVLFEEVTPDYKFYTF